MNIETIVLRKDTHLVTYKEKDGTLWTSHRVCKDCFKNIVIPQEQIGKTIKY